MTRKRFVAILFSALVAVQAAGADRLTEAELPPLAEIEQLVEAKLAESSPELRAEELRSMVKTLEKTVIIRRSNAKETQRFSELAARLAVSPLSRAVEFRLFRHRPSSGHVFPAMAVGETIYVSEELGFVPADELTALVAHEMSHDPRDFVRLLVVDGSNLPDRTKEALRRRTEMRADQRATKMLADAGSDPRSLVSLLEHLKGGMDDAALEERIAEIRKHLPTRVAGTP